MVCIKQSTSSPTYSWVLSLARFTTGCSTKFITMWLLDLLFPSLFHNQSSSAFKSMLLWCWCSQCCALCVFHVSMLAMMSMRGVLNTPSIPWNMSEMSEKILRHVSWDRWSIFVWKFCSSIWVQLFYRMIIPYGRANHLRNVSCFSRVLRNATLPKRLCHAINYKALRFRCHKLMFLHIQMYWTMNLVAVFFVNFELLSTIFL
jgi:hypothetical protein